MKKIFITLTFLFTIFTLLPAIANDNSDGGIGDAYQNTGTFENAFVGQKKVTNEDFQKALDEVKSKQSKGKKKSQFQGKNFNADDSGDYIKDTADNVLILSLPVELTNNDGNEIPVGLYKVVGEKVNDKVYLNFYQSYDLIAKVPAVETNSDFKQPDINFVKLIPYDNKRVEVIYGSMDFNAYSFIRIKDNTQSQN